MNTYYNANKECGQCNFYTETVSHILNGCKAMKAFYQKRHNRIVDMLYDKIISMKIHEQSRVIKDSIIRPQMFNVGTAETQFESPAKRPDIMIINDNDKTAYTGWPKIKYPLKSSSIL